MITMLDVVNKVPPEIGMNIILSSGNIAARRASKRFWLWSDAALSTINRTLAAVYPLFELFAPKLANCSQIKRFEHFIKNIVWLARGVALIRNQPFPYDARLKKEAKLNHLLILTDKAIEVLRSHVTLAGPSSLWGFTKENETKLLKVLDQRTANNTVVSDVEAVNSTQFPELNEKGMFERLWSYKDILQLDLSGNRLLSIPKEINTLAQLRVLNLSGNGFIGFPRSVLLLANLEELHLNDNALSELPQELESLAKLRRLFLRKNAFSTLPVIPNLPSLVTLNLGENRLTQVPQEIVQYTALQYLKIDRNPIEKNFKPKFMFESMPKFQEIEVTGIPDRAELTEVAVFYVRSGKSYRFEPRALPPPIAQPKAQPAQISRRREELRLPSEDSTLAQRFGTLLINVVDEILS